MRRLRLLAGAVLAAGAAGCSSLGYYGQAVDGHLDLMAARRSLEAVIDDADTPAQVRERLVEAREMRDFAAESLALPAGGSYRTYVALERRYVVWNVVAAPELSVEPRTWCFPVAGCVAYRGYFDETAAREFAATLASEGLDVHVGGARAYSTLGWFDDPIVSSMLSPRPYELAGVIFHELAHERVYAAGDSAFNEAYAVSVERAGVRRWLASTARADLAEEYERVLVRRAAFHRAVLDTRAELAELYGSDRTVEERRAGKARALTALRERLLGLAREWDRPGALRAWTDGPVNNARLALVATYHEQVAAFEALLAREGGDLARFHAEVERIAALSVADREAALARAGGVEP